MTARPPREDPFGQRFLRDEETVFDYNAWDGVDFPEEKLAEVEKTLETQKEAAVDQELADELRKDAHGKWDSFYETHSDKFFKDRKWLTREFPEVFQSTGNIRCLDVGCGVGNTTFPLLAANPNLFMFSCDFSANAIQILRNSEEFSADRCSPFVWDITDPSTKIPVDEGSLDYIFCVYVLSALPPEKVENGINNLVRLLKPGGMLCVKDYGRHDLTQLRFKKQRYIDDNFYCRGDGTLVYFFTQDELHELFEKAGLDKVENWVDKRLVVNRAKKVTMYRRWMQCKYKKPDC
ncbi:unnamed protein product [Bursaphelenchus okinawaensis]|uniref:tRNA N(3)-methylcytidine methyltransferase n=1 Tax=Bursaphelenchus okinawaensis TaxID=465554 RepID=A0A811K4Z0_9BILA|nr:unnamed protein product [Bursaphelenchus okinawaensis]CAG9091442.1 unnamed protein product [Bursaphelenchus okinawaensis]